MVSPPVPPPANLSADEAEIQALAPIVRSLHAKLVEGVRAQGWDKLPLEKQRPYFIKSIEALIENEGVLVNFQQRQRLTQELIDESLGFGPLERLLRDSEISDILINGASQVYVERRGRLEHSPVRFRDNEHLMEIVRRIVGRVGRRVDEGSPMVDARLADGSRVNAIIPPLAFKGPMVSIRRFGAHRLSVDDLIRFHAITPEMAEFLAQAVRARLNILVSGGTGSGRTTLLNALSSSIRPDERLITIEDAAELQLQQEHVGSLETRPANVEGRGAVTMRDLVKNALRMRPNRIIVGECRGAEALDMLQAMNTGHEGSMTTLHANSPRDALARLEMMILMTGIELPLRAIRQQIASAVDIIVQVSRLLGGPRKVVSVSEIVGLEGEVITLQELFVFWTTGVDTQGKAVGQFEATGIRTHRAGKMEAAGCPVPAHLFAQRVLGSG
jgi:pilus assembly protein CpaF